MRPRRPVSKRVRMMGLGSWWGDRLGGWPPGASQHSTIAAGIRELRRVSKQANRLLLCAEEHPKDCHRHSLICGPHFPEAIHICRGSTFTAEALSADIAADELPFTP